MTEDLENKNLETERVEELEPSLEEKQEAEEFLETDEGKETMADFEKEEEMRTEREKILAQAEKERKAQESREDLEKIRAIAMEKNIPLTSAYKVYLTSQITEKEREAFKPDLEDVDGLMKQLKESNPRERREIEEKLVAKWLNL